MVFHRLLGAIDGSHIPIGRPDESASDYYNRKGYYSIIMQAMVNFRGLFMGVDIGWPDKVHGACVVVNSFLYQKGKVELCCLIRGRTSAEWMYVI